MVVWNQIEELSHHFKDTLTRYSNKTYQQDEYGWENWVFEDNYFRRAHLQIVDFREKHKMYILHLTVFPHVNNSSPIFGFDVVSGENKITGVFHDFSVVCPKESLLKTWFQEQTKKYQWNKIRTLPDWAQKIFSPDIIAIGNIRYGEELNNICDFAKTSLHYYLNNISSNASYENHIEKQNRYCHFQKQNPHVINSMVSMGIQKETMYKFVNEVLFPELPTYQYAK